MDYDQLRKLNESLYIESRLEIQNKTDIVNSVDRTLYICEHNAEIISSIENDFLQKAKLSKQDIPFLFMAVSLQTIRWMLLPSLDLKFSKIPKSERLESNEVKHGGCLDGKKSGRRYEISEINRYKNKYYEKYTFEESEYRKKMQGAGEYKYLSWIEILFHAVPYDAMAGSENILIKSRNALGKTTFISPLGKQLSGKNHHVATLGHDPVLGWVFGTMNIMSSMITFCDLQTFPVKQNLQLDKWQQTIDYSHPSSIAGMTNYCLNSFREDYKRVPAAVARQAIHMQSDKFTKDGLQIPLLTPDIAQDLINRGWNNNEMDRLMKKAAKNVGIVSAQYFVTQMIDMIIRSMYLLMNIDKDISIIKVKIEKILAISNVIAECSNVAVVAATKDLSRLDIGGMISMVHQIAFNLKTRTELEMEYLKNEFDALIMEEI